MNKSVFAVLLLALITICGAELSERGKKIIQQCQQQFHIETEQIRQTIKKKEIPVEEDGRCFLDCVMEKSGLLQNSSFDGDKLKEINADYLKDDTEDVKTKTNKVIDMCVNEVKNPAGKCNFGVDLIKCVAKHAKELGIATPKITNLSEV